MAPDEPSFSSEEKAFLNQIRDEITERPAPYVEGVQYLINRFSAETLHAEDVKTWERLQKANHREAKPDRTSHSYWLSNRLGEAFVTLLREGIETDDGDLRPYDPVRAKAVLCLTWLLTDRDAHQHPLGQTFGAWGRDFDDQIGLKGRAMARMATLDYDGEYRSQWMLLVREAWAVLSKPRKPAGEGREVVPVERILQLPIPNEFKPTLLHAARYVLAHADQFDSAARQIDARLEHPDDGATPRKNRQLAIFWLTDAFPDLVRTDPPALQGPEYVDWTRQLLLMTTFATYPGDLSRFGTCGAIPWDNSVEYGSLSARCPDELIPLPVMGREWILFEHDNVLRDEMVGKSGESVATSYNRLIEGKFCPAVVERIPWKVRGVLEQLVERLRPILQELESSPHTSSSAGSIPTMLPLAEDAGPIWAGITEVMRHFNIPGAKYSALDGRLKRFRRKHLGDGNAVVEHDAPGRNMPRYLYNLNLLGPVVADLAPAPDRTSDKRPTE